MDRQCPSCGGFCKKSGCERADYVPPKREWVGLTDEEINDIQHSDDGVDYELFDEGEYGFEINIYPTRFARAIEAKLKEKNT